MHDIPHSEPRSATMDHISMRAGAAPRSQDNGLAVEVHDESSNQSSHHQHTVPSLPSYRGGRNYPRFHSFSIADNQPGPNSSKVGSQRRSWKRTSGGGTTPRLRTICYGYASASYQDEYPDSSEEGCPVDEMYGATAEVGQSTQHAGIACGAGMGSHDSGEAPPSEDVRDEENVIFFTRLPDNRVLPICCSKPTGHKADEFIQSLSERQRDKLRKFMEREQPVEGEAYMWVREESAAKTTVLSIRALENHFKVAGLDGGQSSQIRRVKWRHLSVDRIQVYRYSIPQITTKFRMRLAGFLSRNYRCCILCVWCLIILLISVGIILSVLFGSTPPVPIKGTNSTGRRQAQYDRSKSGSQIHTKNN